MNRPGFATLLASAMMISGTANGAIEAVAFLNIENFGLFVDTGAGVPGAPITAGVHIWPISASLSSNASADVASIPGVASNNQPPTPSPFGLDALIAQQGSAFADDSLFPLANPGAPVPRAAADITGSGAFIAGIPDGMGGVIPFGANVYKTAQVHLGTNPFSTDAGSADTSDMTSATWDIIPSVPLSIVGIFDATQYLLADLTLTPPAASASASTSISLMIATAAGTVFTWSPDGVMGSGISGTIPFAEYSDPFSLNASITTMPGSTSGLMNSTVGGGAPPQFSVGVTLAPGIRYTLSILETVNADAVTVAAPLPGDANGDNQVNRDDLAIVARSYGLTFGAVRSDGDFDDNGRVDLLDARILQSNFGLSLIAHSAAAVPEPSSIVLLLGGLIAIGAFRRLH